MLKEIWEIKNGDMLQDYPIYSCDICKESIECAWPMYTDGNGCHLCIDCAFKEGKFTAKEYLQNVGGGLDMFNVGINNSGEIEYWKGKNPIPPWERTLVAKSRNIQGYKEWRTSVFERDNYTCQHCAKHGGELNAHHIKSFKKYPELRLNINNGITLCLDCHKKIHKERRLNG